MRAPLPYWRMALTASGGFGGARSYADQLDDSGNVANRVGKEDGDNVFMAMGGNTSDPKSRVQFRPMEEKLLEEYGLEANLKDTFGYEQDEMSREDVMGMVGVAH